MPFRKKRKKSHLSNARKWCHWNYKPDKADKATSTEPAHVYDQIIPKENPVCDIPEHVLKLCNQFPGRNVASLYSFTQMFGLLNKNCLFSNWQQIKHSDLLLTLCTFKVNESAPVAEKTLVINTNLTWKVIVNNNPVHMLQGIPVNLYHYSAFLSLLNAVDTLQTCPGITDQTFSTLAKDRHGIFVDRSGKVNAKVETDINDSHFQIIRHKNCTQIVAKGQAICNACMLFQSNLNKIIWKENRNSGYNSTIPKTHPSSHCPWKYLTEVEKKKRIEENRRLREQQARVIKKLKEKIKKEAVELNEEDDSLVSGLFEELKKSNNEKTDNTENFKAMFMKEQEKILKCKNSVGRRWHPLIIRWCIYLHSLSPKTYKVLRDSQILLLPNERTLRDYSHCCKGKHGFHDSMFDSVKIDAINRKLKDHEFYVTLIHDEVSLKDDLIFDDEGKLIGFVDLGNVQNSIDELEQYLENNQPEASNPPHATHMFVFMIVSLFSEWRAPVAFFPTTTIKSFALFNLFWKCIEMLEERSFKVLVTTCDGASPHRKFYKFHHPPGTPRGTLIYKTTNPFSSDSRALYFMCDPVHLLKTTRNNWENSFWRNKTKKRRNNGEWITWCQLIDAFENDINQSNVSGLRIMHKLSADHLFLNPFLRMRVYLAAQVFSNRVAVALTVQNRPGTKETVKFVQHMNDFFDCINANNAFTQYEFKSVYRLHTDHRLVWLEDTFLKYFEDWKDWAMSQTDVPVKERKKYFISNQTWEGLQIAIKSFVEVVRFCLALPGVEYFVGTKINQDPIEKFFGKMRQRRGAYTAFNCKEFAQTFTNVRFENSHIIKSIKRTNNDLPDMNLPKRKKS